MILQREELLIERNEVIMEDIRLPTAPISVKLVSVLAGRSKDFNIRDTPNGWTNADTLDSVKHKISRTLRDTNMYVINEKLLALGESAYPSHYVAGWFISEQTPLTELVVVAHANSMMAARKIMMDAMPNIDWAGVSADVVL